MQQEGRDDKAVADDPGLHAPPKTRKHIWPWGLVALAVIGLGWVGIYLLWNGMVFLFGI